MHARTVFDDIPIFDTLYWAYAAMNAGSDSKSPSNTGRGSRIPSATDGLAMN
jgi:hypothetical protein